MIKRSEKPDSVPSPASKVRRAVVRLADLTVVRRPRLDSCPESADWTVVRSARLDSCAQAAVYAMARKPRRTKLEAMVEGSWWDCKVVKRRSPGTYRVHFKNFTKKEDEVVHWQHIRCRSRKFSSRGCKHLGKIFPGDDCAVFVAHPALQHLRHGAEAWYDAQLVRVKEGKQTDPSYHCDGKCHCKFEVRLYKMDIVYQQDNSRRICTFRPSMEKEIEERTIEVGVNEVCTISRDAFSLEILDRDSSSSSPSE